jgi:cytochrome c-type biogenesis protein CcmH
MLFWVLSALLTLLALFALLRPLLRKSAPEPLRAAYDMLIYRDQLDEIGRDVARGVLGETEAAAARLEIERKLLASQPRTEAIPAAGPGLSVPAIRIGAVATAIAVPALALAVYFDLGSPGLPDAPLSGRQASERKLLTEDGSLDLAKAKEAIEAKLANTPQSLYGWVLLAQTDASQGDWKGAHAAFDKVMTLSNRSPEMLEAYGDMLVTEARGEVKPEAVALLQEAVAARPNLFRATYFLALAKAQQGDIQGALADWRAQLAAAPEGASWADTLKDVIAQAEQAADSNPAPPVPSSAAGQPPPEMAAIMQLPAGDRVNAIRSMVAGLAAKLAEEPGDLEGWKRLARSYRVLGEAQKSADAYDKAVALDPADTDLLVKEADALQATMPGDAPIALAVTGLYKKVLDREPEQPQALWFLGLSEKQAGHGDAAAAYWRRLLAQMKPDSPEARTLQQQLATVTAAK